MNSWDITLVVGPNEQYGNLSDALAHIPEEPYRVLILVCRDLTQDIDSYIPTDCNIQYLKIASSDNSDKTINFLGCNFFSNGIPLEIDSTITMKDCFIFGGSQADKGKPVVTTSSKIIINGKVDYVYGGGYAIGLGSISTVHDATVVVDGQVSHLYGGGYAVQSGAVHSGRIHIQINENGTIDRIVNGGNCLVGPNCHSIIREIDIHISGKVYGNVSLGGYAAYSSSTSIHDEIRLATDTAKLSGAIYDGIKLDEKCSITITKVTGSISSEQQELLKFSDHKIQIIQSEPVYKSSGTQKDHNKNENADNYRSPDKEGNPDFSDSIISDTSASEQTEDKKTEVTPSEIPAGNDHLQLVPDNHIGDETTCSSDKDKLDDSTAQPIVDSPAAENNQNENVTETSDNISSDEQQSETDTTQSCLSEISESPIDEGIHTSTDQTLPDPPLVKDNSNAKLDIIPDSIPPSDTYSQTEIEPDKSYQENIYNDHFLTEDNHSDGKKNESYQPRYDDLPKKEKKSAKRLLPIIWVLFILITLLIICFLFFRQKTNNQITPTEYISTKETNNAIMADHISNVLSTFTAEMDSVSGNSISPSVLSMPTDGNKDNPGNDMIVSLSTPTETIEPMADFTLSVLWMTSTNIPVTSITPIIPSSTIKPTTTKVMDIPTASEKITVPTEIHSTTPVTTNTPIILSVTPKPTSTEVIPSYTPTTTEEPADPTASATIYTMIFPCETSTPQLSESTAELVQNIIPQEEKPRLATIQVAVDTGTYYYQRPYKSQEFILRWLSNETEVEILNGPVFRNDYEWYEVSYEQLGLIGWVISNALSINE